MSKVKNRDRKQKSNVRADHGVHDSRTGKATMIDMHDGDSPVLTPTAVAQPASRKKERRYGHN